MYKTISQVLASPINNSKSKQAHCFSRQSRFPKTQQSQQFFQQNSCQRSSYDLANTDFSYSALMSRSVSKFNKQRRFQKQEKQWQRRSLSPSPDTYKLGSFTDKHAKINHKSIFNKEEKLKLKKNNVPGPGRYQTSAYNPEVQLSYTMRNRTKKSNTHWSEVGPGQYNPNESIKNMTKSQYGKINKDSRFKDFSNGIPAPDAYKNMESLGQQVSSKFNGSSKYTFGHQKRGRRMKTTVPGPGQYEPFSQFSCDDKDIFMRSYTNL